MVKNAFQTQLIYYYFFKKKRVENNLVRTPSPSFEFSTLIFVFDGLPNLVILYYP